MSIQIRKVPSFLFRQSGIIPYRFVGDQLEILLITSRRKRRWIVPKGVVEKGLSAHESAAKESMEEAGVKGHVSEVSVGFYTYEKWGGTCRVEIFPMEVTEELEEYQDAAWRKRRWCSEEEVLTSVTKDGLNQVLRDFMMQFQ